MRKLLLLAVAVSVAGIAVYLMLNWTSTKYRITGTVTRDGKALQWKGDKTRQAHLQVLAAQAVTSFIRADTVSGLTQLLTLKRFQDASTEEEKIALLVIFVPLDRKANRDIYRCQNVTDPKTGTFVITDIPAGKYRVSIQQMDPFPTHDLLQFKYPIHNSPILRDVNGDATIDIDLPKDLPK